jgi:hypothetical protein|tara:strand:+ start:5164 stop:6930 length:1767 start_codon:yes stop_codon:yes gene_type:complete
MAIFRGTGGAGSANDDVTVTTVTTKASEAAASASAASSSASSASTSATSATNSASTATTKASEASTSKDTATTKASEASTSATAAASSATAAAASAATVAQDIGTSDSPTFAGLTINGAIVASSTVDGRDLQTDGSKLDGIEASATADQSNAEIRTAVEAASNSNVFTDADHSKLNAIEASATADQTDAQIRTAVEAASDSNVFTDADHTKLNGVAASSNNYVHPNHSGEVTSTADGATVIASAVVDEANLKISNSPTNGQFLSAQSGNTGGLTWAVPTNTTYSVGDGGLTTNDFTNDDHSKLNAIEASADVTDATNVTAAGALMDSELAGIAAVKATTGTFLSADESKLDGIAASANNYVHPNHSGEVTSTSDGATVIVDNIVDEANLKVSNAPTNGYALTAQSGDAGGMTWASLVGKQTMWIPAGAMYPSTTNPCSDLEQVQTTALRPDLKVLDFATGADEFAQFSIAFPKSWNEGTLTFQPFWTVTGTNTGTVAWQLGGIAVSSDDTINTAFGTLVATTALAHSGTSNDLMMSAESGAVTIAGSPAANDVCFFQVNRDVSADTQSGDARLLGIKLFFTNDALTDA